MVDRSAVPRRVIQITQGIARYLRRPDIFTRPVLRDGVGKTGRIELDRGGEDVGHGLVEPTGFAGIDQIGCRRRDPVRQLMGNDIDRDQRACRHAVAVAIGDTLTGRRPVGIDIILTEVHPTQDALAFLIDAQSTMGLLIVVPGQCQA